MGQKTIPTSLRLKQNENWHSKWIANKNEYSNLLHFDLEVKKIFIKLFYFRKIELIQLNFVKLSKNIYIYIYLKQSRIQINRFNYYQIIYLFHLYLQNYNIKIFVKKIKLKVLFERPKIYQLVRLIKNKYKKTRFKPKNLNVTYTFAYALLTKNIQMITFLIKKKLEKKKFHKKKIRWIEKQFQFYFLIFSNFLGYRLQLKGRINNSKRKKKMIYQKGKIPLNTLKYNILYHFNEFQSPSGKLSIKLWIFLNEKKQTKQKCYFLKKQNIKNNLKVN